jgi:hypothetical protein
MFDRYIAVFNAGDGQCFTKDSRFVAAGNVTPALTYGCMTKLSRNPWLKKKWGNKDC